MLMSGTLLKLTCNSARPLVLPGNCCCFRHPSLWLGRSVVKSFSSCLYSPVLTMATRTSLVRSRLPHLLCWNHLGRSIQLRSVQTFPSNASKTNIFLRMRSHSILRQLVRFCSSKPSGNIARNASKKSAVVFPKKSDIGRLINLAKPEKWRLLGAICLLLISSGVTLAVPFGIGRVIDIIYTQAEDGQMLERLRYFCSVLLGIFIIGGFANFGRVYLMSTAGQRVVKRLREKLFGSIIAQEIAFFDRNRTGELINRLSSDTSLVGQSITMNISDGLRSVAQAIGGIAMMVVVSPKLTLVALSIVPPIAVVSIIYGRYVRRITRQVQDSLAESTQVAEERLSNMRTVRAFVQEASEFNKYDKQIAHVLDLSYREALARGIYWGSTGLSGNVIILSVFYYGGILMQDSLITVGELSSFLMYAAYIGISMGGLSSFYTEVMKALGASSRLWELTDRQPLIPLTAGVSPDVHIQGNLEFRDIHFCYPTREDVSIFSGLSLNVPGGSVLALVGPSGSGKSTLPALLLRFYDPHQGSVFLDGYDIKELSPTWLRRHIGIVNQEPTLFSCSIADNIAYGALNPSSVTVEEITEAARKANACNFIAGFPRGLDTLVGERGVMLSGGQKQRIAIARAILKDPKILLLDEATSALDAESEYLVQEALERVMVDRTVITIAHRLSTIKNADQIAVLDQGHIVEQGDYITLMTIQDGLFRRLVERQTIASQ